MNRVLAVLFSAILLLPLLGLAEEGNPDGVLTSFFGRKLVNAAGEEVEVAGLDAGKIGIYFSAHWCPPCRGFTPRLVEFYRDVKKEHADFEIVFVSSDRSAEAMKKYMSEAEMPWLAVPYGADQVAELAERYGVRGIPTLVVIDKDGKTLSMQGRREVAAQGVAAYQDW